MTLKLNDLKTQIEQLQEENQTLKHAKEEEKEKESDKDEINEEVEEAKQESVILALRVKELESNNDELLGKVETL